MTCGVPLLVSYHFAFSYCSWGSQGKNTKVVCLPFSNGPHSVRPLRHDPPILGCPSGMVWFHWVRQGCGPSVIRLACFLWVWFQCVCPLMPSCNIYHFTWVSLTLGVVYLFTAAPAKHSHCSLPWMRGISLPQPFLTFNIRWPLGPPVPVQPPLLTLLLPAVGPGLRCGWLLPGAAPGIGLGVAPQGHRPWPQAWGCFSWPPLTSDTG